MPVMRVRFSHVMAAALSGLLLAAAFPKWDHTYLLPIALIPLFWAVRDQAPGWAFWLGLLSGLVHYAGLLYWIIYVTVVYGGLPVPVGVGVLLLLAGYLSLYRGLWAWGVARGEKRGLSLMWLAPAWWTALELGQTYILFGGFPWELLGNGLYRQPLLMQLADITGVYGLSFMVVLVNAAIYLALWLPRASRGVALKRLALAGLLVGLWAGYGHYSLARLDRIAAESPKIRVAVIQGNIKQGEKWRKEMVQTTLARYAELSAQVKGAHLIVWPETAAPFFYLRAPELTEQVQQVAKDNDAFLLFGAPAWELTPTGEQYFNRTYLLNPQGEVAGKYDKAHLVPYGEYVPMKRYLPFLGKVTEAVGDFTPGPVGGAVSLPEGAVGPLICFESIFPYLSRAQVQNGVQLLVNLTNDAWYGATSAPYQSLAIAAVRAVESRVCLARAANTGISAFVDGAGRILWESGLFVPEAKALDLPWLPGGSLYTRFGDVFAWTCVILAGLALLFARRRFPG